jgi:hypothetical protein
MRPDLSVVSNQAVQVVARPRCRARALLGSTAVMLGLVSFAGCTAQQRQGDGSSYLILSTLECASGAKPDDRGNTCSSDVVTYVKQQVGGQEVKVSTLYEDGGLVTFTLGMKDPSATVSPTNYISINRYRVQYVRADGRNTPGVDVPYPFDGAMTLTVGDREMTGSFSIVRLQAKAESPLKQLAGGGGAIAIATLADVTFYGKDQAGHDVSVTGHIGINFADWGDPE